MASPSSPSSTPSNGWRDATSSPSPPHTPEESRIPEGTATPEEEHRTPDDPTWRPAPRTYDIGNDSQTFIVECKRAAADINRAPIERFERAHMARIATDVYSAYVGKGMPDNETRGAFDRSWMEWCMWWQNVRETDEQEAERLVQEWLDATDGQTDGYTEDVQAEASSEGAKVEGKKRRTDEVMESGSEEFVVYLD